jgi:hypothetical protein
MSTLRSSTAKPLGETGESDHWTLLVWMAAETITIRDGADLTLHSG